jgi:putative peptidoglycan lipid II flippase
MKVLTQHSRHKAENAISGEAAMMRDKTVAEYSGEKTLAKGSAGVSLASGMALVMGFLSSAMMAGYFGLTIYTDAFFLAQIIPNLLSRVFAAASDPLFVPVFVRHIGPRRDSGSGLFWGSLSVYGGLSLILIAALGMLASPYLVITSAKEVFYLAVAMSRVFFVTFLFYSSNEVLKSVLNAAGYYVWASLSDNLRYLGAIVAMLLGHNVGVIIVAYGYLAGAVCQTLLLLVVAFRLGVCIIVGGRKPHEDFLVLLRRAPAVIGGNMISFATEGVERYLASGLGVGALTILGYARQLVFATFNITIKSTSVVILPMLSAAAAQGLRSRAKDVVASGLRLTALLTSLTCFGLIAFSEVICRLLFVHGSFTLDSANLVALLVILYAPSVLFGGLNQMFLAPYYAFGAPRVPMLQYVFIFVTDVVFSIGLSKIFGVWGLALSFSLVHALAVLRIQWLFARDFGRPQGKFVVLALGLLVGGIGMVIVGRLGDFLYVSTLLDKAGRPLHNAILLAILAPMSMVAFLAPLWIMGVEEMTLLRQAIARTRTRLATLVAG